MKVHAVTEVELSLIDFLPQVRRRFDEAALARLEASIRAIGMQQPVQLRPTENGHFVPLDGERRCRAAKAAGLTSVPAVVVTDTLEAAGIVERQLALNIVRHDLNPMEVARGVEQIMRETGRTARDVGAAMGFSGASMTRLLSLLTLAPEIQAEIEAGKIPASVAAELARVTDVTVQRSLAEEVAAGRLTRDAVVARVRRRKSTPAESNGGAAAGRVTAVLAGGRSITLTGPGLDSLDALIEWLNELAGEARKVRSQHLELATFLRMLRDRAKSPNNGK